jgi:integrase
LEIEIQVTEPYQDFLFAMNSPVTRERYSTRLRSFFVFVGIEGTTMGERCRGFIEKMKETEKNDNVKWAYACVVKFLQYQKDRYDKKEISGSTVRGYYKAVKLFAEVNGILLPWSKIKRGLPRGRHYADDRIPTLDEIRKLVEYPDRRIKAIIFTMASSGIRLGAWDYLKWGHVKPIIRNEQTVAADMKPKKVITTKDNHVGPKAIIDLDDSPEWDPFYLQTQEDRTTDFD